MVPSSDTSRAAAQVPGVVEKPYGLYPGLEFFTVDYGADDYRGWIEQSNGDPLPAPLALYIQDYCTGDSPPVRGRDISSSRRLAAIEQELKMQGALFDADRPVQQFICSGSIATEWTDDQLYHLISVVQDSFFINQSGLASWCACLGSVVPPRERLRLLRILGFSHVRYAYIDQAGNSAGLEQLKASVEMARQLGIQKIALDLIHGEKSVKTSVPEMERFLADASPDRVRLTGENADQHESYVGILSSLGYQNIGLDWFLRPDDLWVEAKAAGRLHWSLLGFTEMSSPDVIGIGPGALSSVGEFYGVNEVRWEEYQAILNRGKLPVVRGIELEADDVLRREIMGMILAASVIHVSAIEEKWGIRFNQFFAQEAECLRRFEQNDWIDWQGEDIRVRTRGFRESVELCKVFDHRARLQLSVPDHSFCVESRHAALTEGTGAHGE